MDAKHFELLTRHLAPAGLARELLTARVGGAETDALGPEPSAAGGRSAYSALGAAEREACAVSTKPASPHVLTN